MYLVFKNGINRYYVNDISWNHLLINTRVDNYYVNGTANNYE